MTAACRPAALDALAPVHLDVREDLRRGAEPFSKIMNAVQSLGPEDALVLRAPFEPAPLYEVLGRRGFAHWIERRDATDWSVWFYRASPAAAPAEATTSSGGTVDVRGLEPPLPMVRVLERLETLAPGETLTILHERRPVFLYPQLDERGFAHVTDEPEPGVVRIRVQHGARG